MKSYLWRKKIVTNVAINPAAPSSQSGKATEDAEDGEGVDVKRAGGVAVRGVGEGVALRCGAAVRVGVGGAGGVSVRP